MHHILAITVGVAAALLGCFGTFATVKGISDASTLAGLALPSECQAVQSEFRPAPLSSQPPGGFKMERVKPDCSKDMFGLRMTGLLGVASKWFSRGQTVIGVIGTAAGGLLLLSLGVIGMRFAWRGLTRTSPNNTDHAPAPIT
jgi:hypothetical protein